MLYVVVVLCLSFFVLSFLVPEIKEGFQRKLYRKEIKTPRRELPLELASKTPLLLKKADEVFQTRVVEIISDLQKPLATALKKGSTFCKVVRIDSSITSLKDLDPVSAGVAKQLQSAGYRLTIRKEYITYDGWANFLIVDLLSSK